MLVGKSSVRKRAHRGEDAVRAETQGKPKKEHGRVADLQVGIEKRDDPCCDSKQQEGLLATDRAARCAPTMQPHQAPVMMTSRYPPVLMTERPFVVFR
jgi:hypothetical protein